MTELRLRRGLDSCAIRKVYYVVRCSGEAHVTSKWVLTCAARCRCAGDLWNLQRSQCFRLCLFLSVATRPVNLRCPYRTAREMRRNQVSGGVWEIHGEEFGCTGRQRSKQCPREFRRSPAARNNSSTIIDDARGYDCLGWYCGFVFEGGWMTVVPNAAHASFEARAGAVA